MFNPALNIHPGRVDGKHPWLLWVHPGRHLEPMGLRGSSSSPLCTDIGGPSPPTSWGTVPVAAETETPHARTWQKAFSHGTSRSKTHHCRMRATPLLGSPLPHPTAGALLACPGRVGEDDVPPLGPAGEDGFLGDETVPGAVGLLVHQVHPTLVQPSLLKVVVGHA